MENKNKWINFDDGGEMFTLGYFLGFLICFLIVCFLKK